MICIKNKIILIVVLAFLISNNNSFCQDSLKIKQRNFLIKIPPFLLIGDFITNSMGIPINIEIKLKRNLSFSQTFSYIIPNRYNGDFLTVDVDNIRGIRTDSEIKRFLNNRNNLTGFYLGTHILYQYTDAFTTLNNIRVFRNLFALHEKIGWQYIGKKGFIFDSAIGIGARYISSHTNCNCNIYGIEYESGLIFSPYNKPYAYGSKWFFSLNTTLAIGYGF